MEKGRDGEREREMERDRGRKREREKGKEREEERERESWGGRSHQGHKTLTSVWEVFSLEVTCNPAAESLLTTSCRALMCAMLFSRALSLYLKANVH